MKSLLTAETRRAYPLDMKQTYFTSEPPKSASFKARSVTLENVQGHAAWSGDLGPNKTIFRGENAVGKSSIINAIRNALHGAAALSSLARVVDGKPTEPKVTVVLEGAPGRKIVTKGADKTPTIKAQVGNSAAYETVKKPGEYLRMITEASADPGRFLTASEKDQNEMLLAALPVEWDQARADEIVGRFADIVKGENLPLDHLYPLQKVDAIHGAIFRARTGVNRDEKAKRAAADQTLRDAPAEIPEGIDDRIAEKRAEISTAQAALSARQEAIRGSFRAAEDAATARYEAAKAAALAEYNAAIAAAKTAAESENTAIATARGALDGLNAELSALLRDQRDATKVKTMHETAAKFEADADSLAGVADSMTAVLAKLEAFRAELVQDIPIHGLTLEGGIKVGGVPFSQVNTATRVSVAFSIATLRLRGLPLQIIFVDNLEALDDAHRDHLYALAEREGVQIIGAERTEGPLTVERS